MSKALARNFVKSFKPLNKDLNLPPKSNWIILRALKPDRRNERPEPSHSRLRGEIRVHEYGIVRQSNTVALTGLIRKLLDSRKKLSDLREEAGWGF